MYSGKKFERYWKFWWTNYCVKSNVDLFTENFSVFLLWYLNLELFLNLISWFLWGQFLYQFAKITWKALRKISDNSYFFLNMIFWNFTSFYHFYTKKMLTEFATSSSSDIVFKLLTKIIFLLVSVVAVPRCSDNMQQIYRKTPMPKRDFNEVAIEIALRYGCSPIFRTPFLKKRRFCSFNFKWKLRFNGKRKFS